MSASSHTPPSHTSRHLRPASSHSATPAPIAPHAVSFISGAPPFAQKKPYSPTLEYARSTDPSTATTEAIRSPGSCWCASTCAAYAVVQRPPNDSPAKCQRLPASCGKTSAVRTDKKACRSRAPAAREVAAAERLARAEKPMPMGWLGGRQFLFLARVVAFAYSMNSTFARLVQEDSRGRVELASALTMQGPSSLNMPKEPVAPGPL